MGLRAREYIPFPFLSVPRGRRCFRGVRPAVRSAAFGPCVFEQESRFCMSPFLSISLWHVFSSLCVGTFFGPVSISSRVRPEATWKRRTKNCLPTVPVLLKCVTPCVCSGNVLGKEEKKKESCLFQSSCKVLESMRNVRLGRHSNAAFSS